MMTNRSARISRITEVSPALLIMPPVLATLFLWVTGINEVETAAVCYAFLLLVLPWGSYVCWRDGGRVELPMFAMVGGAYWVYFALALFWGHRTLIGAASFATVT